METETETRTAVCGCRNLTHEDTCPENPDAALCEECGVGVSSSEIHAAELGRLLCRECCHYEARSPRGACCEAFN